ncbi:MAG TPA: hypothetical protein VKS20_10615 [Candidatus Acidoferrales bacterium]|nr:hypothetical protein [Candidatus Acidoferrales bacterium]
MCYAQDLPPNIPQAGAQNPAQPAGQLQDSSQTGAQSGTIVVPAGTQISATLSSPIISKSKKGDTVRAMVAFPVTVGTQLVIPAGTYVTGVIENIVKHGIGAPKVQVKFTNLVYANGYTVALDAGDAQAELAQPVADLRAPAAPGDPANGVSQAYALTGNRANAFQTGPTPPPLPPSPGPPKGFIIGIVVSTVVMAILFALSIMHVRRGRAILFDTGWQFDIVLQSPLTLNAANVAAAITAAPAQ